MSMQRSSSSSFPPPPAYPDGGAVGRPQGVNIDVTIGKNVAGGAKTTGSPSSPGYIQNKSITSSGITIQVNKEGPSQSSPGNYVNVSKIDNQRSAILAGVRASTAAGKSNYANLPPQDSTYSSPRSSICSYDSKGSSPRGSMANHPPPPPYDFQRHTGSPLVLGSPRSSISTDSKQSGSPRASLTALHDKFPGHRANAQSALYISTGGHDGVGSGTQQSPRSISLFERFNEPAPPPHYDIRSRAHQIPVQHIHVHSGGQGHRPVSRPGLPIPEPHGHSQMHPIRVVHTSTSPGQQQTFASTNRPSTQNAVPPTMRLRGLNYDVVPPKLKEGQSEAEKKLAALTEQLEKDMHIGNTTSMSRKNSDASSEPPPPPYPGSRPTVIPVKSATPQQSFPPANHTPNLVSPASSTSSRSATVISPYKTPLPVQITPPKPQGPTDAEKKLDALTQDLESQMDKNPQGDYYGEHCTF